MKFLTRRIYALLKKALKPLVQEIYLGTYSLYGSKERLFIAPTASVTNTLFNTYSGSIEIRDHAFMGHNVSILTGSHDYTKTGFERMQVWPKQGNNVLIEEGVWICSNVVVVGPVTIGKDSVVAAGSVVTDDIPSGVVAGGVPAKVVKKIRFNPISS